MKIEINARGTGKTSRMLAAMAAEPTRSIMICHSATAARDTYLMALNLFPQTRWTLDQFIPASSSNLRYHNSRDEWRFKYIDNLDLCLQAIFGRVDGVTMNGPSTMRWSDAPEPVPAALKDDVDPFTPEELSGLGKMAGHSEEGAAIVRHAFEERGYL